MRSIQKQVKTIINEVAKKYGVSGELVEDVFYTQFEFVVFNMEKGNKFKDAESFENIYLRHLGSFISNKRAIAKMIHIDKKVNYGNDIGEDLDIENNEIE